MVLQLSDTEDCSKILGYIIVFTYGGTNYYGAMDKNVVVYNNGIWVTDIEEMKAITDLVKLFKLTEGREHMYNNKIEFCICEESFYYE